MLGGTEPHEGRHPGSTLQTPEGCTEEAHSSVAITFLRWLNQSDRMCPIYDAIALLNNGEEARAAQRIRILAESGALIQLANILLLDLLLLSDPKKRLAPKASTNVPHVQVESAFAGGLSSNEGLQRRRFPASVLTSKQRVVLRFVKDGMTNQQIAYRMSVSLNTVKWHLKNISRALGASNRCSVLRIAEQKELI